MSLKQLLSSVKYYSVIEILLSYLSYQDLQNLLLVCKDWRQYFTKNSKSLQEKIFQEKLETGATKIIFQKLTNSSDILWYSTNTTGWLMSSFCLKRQYISYKTIPRQLKKFYLLERAFLVFGDRYKIAIDNITYHFCPKKNIIQVNHDKICTCCLDSTSSADPVHLEISYTDEDYEIKTIVCLVCLS